MIAAKLEDCLHSWGIDKVLTLTVDNASSNDLCVQELLKVFKFNDVLLDNKFFHVRCSAHILNLIVKDGLKEHFSSIARVRNACKYVRSSPARLKSFRKCVVKEKITLSHSVIIDVDTRWTSTYMMLDRDDKYEMVFDRLHMTDKSFHDCFDCYESVYDDNNVPGKKEKKFIGPPRKEDWVVARNFVAFLKLFYDVTLKFSSTLNVTSNNCVAQLCKVKQSIDLKMDTESSSNMFSMATSMSSKFKKYWENWSNINHLLFVAVVFDPRFKIKGVEVCLKIMYGIDSETRNADIENHVNSLFAHYSKESSFHDLEPSRSLKKSKVVIESESEDIFSMIAREMGADESNDSKNELSIYLNEGIEKSDNFDLLGWWKSNAARYPVLSRIAKDILAIPVSTVASEQAFSTSGRVIDAYRSSLSPTTMEALVCAQNWIRTEIPLDLCKAFDEIDKYEEIAQEIAQESSSSCLTWEDVLVDSD